MLIKAKLLENIKIKIDVALYDNQSIILHGVLK